MPAKSYQRNTSAALTTPKEIPSQPEPLVETPQTTTPAPEIGTCPHGGGDLTATRSPQTGEKDRRHPNTSHTPKPAITRYVPIAQHLPFFPESICPIYVLPRLPPNERIASFVGDDHLPTNAIRTRVAEVAVQAAQAVEGQLTGEMKFIINSGKMR